MNTVMIKMTDVYGHQDFFNKIKDLNIVDCRDLDGTRCYLDDSAKATILSRIKDYSPSGIHFIDSGNYHYLSLLWLSKIKEDFNLVLLDNHPDNQPPSFGAITSCGGWVLEAKETLPNLKNVYTYGTGDEIPVSDIPTDLPLYISIDKDILSKDYCISDWDQGEMTLDEMIDILNVLLKNHQIIGVDICGDSGEMAEEAAFLNNQTNLTLFDFLSVNF